MSVRIVCINKSEGDHDNPNEAISRYGWINESTGESGFSIRQIMVDWVSEGNVAYVIGSLGVKVYCHVRTSPRGTEFLQTYSDDRPTNNLLELQECNQ
ncbi:MAG: DUF3892 domain-containing protein [Patescibacteria group bacterium]